MSNVINNIIWLMVERGVSLIGGLIVTIYVARYLGPTDMGVINYAIAFSAIIIPIAQLGSEQIFFNRVSKKKISGEKLIISTSRLRFGMYVFCAVSLFVFYKLRSGNVELNHVLIFIILLVSTFFTSQDVYRVYFDGLLKSKLNTISASIGLWCSLVFRLLFVKMGLGVVWFAVPFLINTAVPFFIRRILFFKNIDVKLISSRCRLKYLKFNIHAGVPLAISGLSVVLYTRVNQIVVGEYIDMQSVAIYNSALTLAQGWVFFPMAIVTTMLAKVLSNEQSTYKVGFGNIYAIVFIMSLPILLLFYFFDDYIVLYSYGEQYIEASKFVFLLSLSSTLSIFATISSRAIIANGGYRYLMFRMLFLSALNVLISCTLVPMIGIQGAVYSIFITELIGTTFANIFFKRGMVITFMLSGVKSLLSFDFVKHLNSNGKSQ